MKNWNFRLGIFLVSVLFLIALFAPWIAPYSPYEDFRGFENVTPSFHSHNNHGLNSHRLNSHGLKGHFFLLGTDPLGRDLFSRLIFGARYCFIMGFFSVFLAMGVGVPLGLYAGLHDTWDRIITKVTDIVISFPSILIAIIVVAVIGPGFINAIVAVGLINIPVFVRLTRGQVKLEVKKEYVLAARTLGMSSHRMLFRHVLPNVASPLLVLTSLSLGTAILESASLSFLNLGATPPTPEWGSMIRSGMEHFLSTNPWVSLFSGFCIFLNVLGFNLLGDGLRDIWDPHFNHGKVL